MNCEKENGEPAEEANVSRSMENTCWRCWPFSHMGHIDWDNSANGSKKCILTITATDLERNGKISAGWFWWDTWMLVMSHSDDVDGRSLEWFFLVAFMMLDGHFYVGRSLGWFWWVTWIRLVVNYKGFTSGWFSWMMLVDDLDDGGGGWLGWWRWLTSLMLVGHLDDLSGAWGVTWIMLFGDSDGKTPVLTLVSRLGPPPPPPHTSSLWKLFTLCFFL